MRRRANQFVNNRKKLLRLIFGQDFEHFEGVEEDLKTEGFQIFLDNL